MALKEVYQLNLNHGFLPTILREDHELVILSGKIDWEAMSDALRSKFSLKGRKAKRLQLMIGLHFLKHLYNLSDERVCFMLEENLYFRYFCGVDHDMQEWLSKTILNPCTMSRFRKRLGVGGMHLIENVIKTQLFEEKRISTKLQIVDTTAVEKNIAYPVDSHLLARGIRKVTGLVGKLKKKGLSVAVRSFRRLVRKEVLKINKLGRGRKERIAEGTKRLIEYAKKVAKAAVVATRAQKKRVKAATLMVIDGLKKQLEQGLDLLGRVINQAQKRLEGIHVKEKVLSLHEPNVAVIAKGKRRKRYEFGAKVSFSVERNGYVVGHQEYHQNVADIKTLDPALDDWAQTFGHLPDELGTDRGYFTSNPSETVSKVRRAAIPTRGRKRHPDADKAYFRRIQRRRNCIEPLIGHLKADHRLDRCRYSGKVGDTLNVGFGATAWNLKKWAREIRHEKRKAA
jgi:IS5 family transposase